MTAALPKRLIEVDLPIKRISEHSRREKSIRHGHISTLHIWWARRPLAACRAVLCASLWPDPADPNCPDSFRVVARQWMTKWSNEYLRALGHESYERFIGFRNDPQKLHDDKELRSALLDFIADFANWDNATVEEYLATSSALTHAAREALGDATGTNTLVVDPFAGGGSIPLEALRVGADAFASDLNPIPVLLNKVVLEYIPKYGERLATEFQRRSAEISTDATRVLSQFYSGCETDTGAAFFLWFKTVLSEAPSTEKIPLEIPLLRSMWLSKAKGRNLALRWVRDKNGKVTTGVKEIAYANGSKLRVRQPLLEIFSPKSPAEVDSGTSRGGAAICPVTGYTTPVESVRKQLSDRKGGAFDARLACVIGTSNGSNGRRYRLATVQDELLFQKAAVALEELQGKTTGRLSLLPEGEINHLRGFFNVVLYGMRRWCDLFSSRQSLALATYARLIRERCGDVAEKEDSDFAAALQTCLSMALGRMVDYESSLCMWASAGEFVCHTFGRQALPMVWDFAEVNPMSDTGWLGTL
jgi:putative DNA methylase